MSSIGSCATPWPIADAIAATRLTPCLRNFPFNEDLRAIAER
jgi:hypothetical protein